MSSKGIYTIATIEADRKAGLHSGKDGRHLNPPMGVIRIGKRQEARKGCSMQVMAIQLF
jgi:hypothetical protein